MVKKSFAILMTCSLFSACSDYHLDRAEKIEALKDKNLSSLSGQALLLSKRYVAAARDTSTVQDIASFLVIGAAGATVLGAVGSASDTTIAKRAVAGTLIHQGAGRAAPKVAIEAIYVGAKQLNCISTVAGIGAALKLSERDELAAEVATIGAINHAKITAREGIVRELENFGTVFEDLKDSVSNAAGLRGEKQQKAAAVLKPGLELDTYVSLLAKCTATKDPTIDKVKKVKS